MSFRDRWVFEGSALADQVVTRDRRAPTALDVGDDRFIAPRMAARIPMEGIGEVTAEHRALPESNELANAIRAAEDAEVRVDSHDDDVRDGALREQVEELLSIVGDRVARLDREELRLVGPWVGRPTLIAGLGGIAGTRPGVREGGR